MRNPFRPLSVNELRTRACAKWRHYPAEVLPLWVAEMDFALADGIKEAIKAHVDSDDLGYPLRDGMDGLRETVAERLERRYGARFPVDGITSLGSTVAGMVYGCRAFTEPGDEVLLLTPLYPPFKRSVVETGRVPVEVELVRGEERYELDMDAVRAAVTPRTRLLMLCNPHNPLGLVYTREELEALAELVLEHDLKVVSDELHADITYGATHVPFASLAPELAERTLTLYGPTKAFNFPGLGICFALTSGPAQLELLGAATGGLHSWPSRLAEAAALAAYSGCDDWLEQALAYLRGNRDRVVEFVRAELPGASVHVPEATYLAWLDLRGTGLGEKPAARLAELAKVGLNEGADFGAGGAGFARLNFATCHDVLEEALSRLASALAPAA
ncbi:MAG TPA: PatB family C-S lyase [Trueperaceae bacterium]|nr:PatB family C-S lyase [Trueperaceae bacterium]